MGDTGRLCCRTEATSRDARGEMLRTPEIDERRDFGNLGDGGARITFESRFIRSLTTVSKIILALVNVKEAEKTYAVQVQCQQPSAC